MFCVKPRPTSIRFFPAKMTRKQTNWIWWILIYVSPRWSRSTGDVVSQIHMSEWIYLLRARIFLRLRFSRRIRFFFHFPRICNWWGTTSVSTNKTKEWHKHMNEQNCLHYQVTFQMHRCHAGITRFTKQTDCTLCTWLWFGEVRVPCQLTEKWRPESRFTHWIRGCALYWEAIRVVWPGFSCKPVQSVSQWNLLGVSKHNPTQICDDRTEYVGAETEIDINYLV